MEGPSTVPSAAALRGYGLRVVQEVALALLAEGAARGSQLRARLRLALGPLAETLNDGHLYVTLGRLEKAGEVRSVHEGAANDRKLYELTDAGRRRVEEWLGDTDWPKPTPAEFHLKLVAAASAGLADPIRLIDAQRHALLADLGAAQRAALAETHPSVAGLLLEGVILRLQADLHWLEACARYWTSQTRAQ